MTMLVPNTHEADVLERIEATHTAVQESYAEMMDSSRTRARTIAIALESTDLTYVRIAQHLGISAEAVAQMNRRGRGMLGWQASQHGS